MSAGVVLAMLAVLVWVVPSLAQQLPIETYPELRQPDTRGDPRRLPDTPTRPPGAAAYPRDVGVRHEPAFIEPLAGRYATKIATGRLGLSGWTAPNVPVGAAQSGESEVTGWFSLGFTLTWGDPY